MTSKRQRGYAAHTHESGPDAQRPARAAHDTSRGGILRQDGRQLLITLRITPRAGREELTLEGGILRARVAAPPVEGAANAALLALLAERLRVPKRSLTLVRGATSREKVVALTGLTSEEVWSRITAS